MCHAIERHVLETHTMPKITKKTRREDGPRATVAKLEDARTLLTTIRQALDKEILERTDDLSRSGLGWTHFGDAGHLLEELKEVGHLLLIDRNEVMDEHACPGCGTRDVDRLLIDESEVRCTVCGTEYTLD
jgi:NurA-like 5'-3' nuclease